MNEAIVTKGLTKVFSGYTAVDNIELKVKRGSIFGFLGPNGAGKTTTIRMLMGLAKISSGQAFILGKDVRKDFDRISQKIGYLPEVPAFYGWMRADEYLRFCGQLFKIENSILNKRIEHLLEKAGLKDTKKPISSYSRGMKQRLGVVQALINEPEVLFLDEPTSALDPIGRKETLALIKLLSEEITVFLSTHILNDVERVCDEIAIINKAKIIIQSNLETLKEKYIKPVFKVSFDEPPGNFAKLLDKSWISEVQQAKNSFIIKVNDMAQAQKELPKIIASSSLKLSHFQIAEESLENIFMRVLSEDV